MPRYREDLPQLSGAPFLTDGGLETTLFFIDGHDLPEFAAFVLLESEEGRESLRAYYRTYADIAIKHGMGFILESMTWRANRDWGAKIGYAPQQLAELNNMGIELLEGIRNEYEGRVPHLVISGCLGPRGEGYDLTAVMTAGEAEEFHRPQIAAFGRSAADMVTAFTIPCADEAVGIVRAAGGEGIPVAIGFTVETDGRLPSGERLGETVEQVDRATNGAPAYYMINCAHPDHMAGALDGGSWSRRVQAVRANASRMSHAELDEATELDAGDPVELGALYRGLHSQLTNFNIFGGCCGTDHRHIEEICRALD